MLVTFILMLHIAGLYYSMVFYVNFMKLVAIQHDSKFNLDPQATDKEEETDITIEMQHKTS